MTQMIVRLDSAAKQRLGRLARAEGKSTSQLVRDVLDDYIRDRDPAAHIDDLWSRMARSIEAGGWRPDDVERVVSEVRRARR